MVPSSAAIGYTNWCAVASYFDGDGTIELEVRKLTLRFRLVWTDNWRDQVEQIRRFLESQGVRTERIVYARGAWHLPIGEINSMRLAARLMVSSGCAFKKRKELLAMLAYYDNRLSGNQVINEFNESVRAGIRSGYERAGMLPLTYKQAKHLQAKLAGARAGAKLQKVGEELRLKIIKDRKVQGVSYERLASIHKVSKTTVGRILREYFGVPRLGRIGDQATLD
ncbi:MAG: hypothetical protein KGI38_04500 [Thaumarchaeota archaeon]|nr:hypothetical protein [Nitrososphaerota archaeon]